MITRFRTQGPSDAGGTSAARRGAGGFTLVEMLIALFILTFGLLAAGQLIFVAVSSTTLARSKGSAAVTAQDELERLADLFRRDPSAADLTVGGHGPQTVQIVNPATNQVLNRFNVTWNVATVPDPRAGRVLNARQVTVTVTPVNNAGITNNRVRLNKVVNVTGIFSSRVP